MISPNTNQSECHSNNVAIISSLLVPNSQSPNKENRLDDFYDIIGDINSPKPWRVLETTFSKFYGKVGVIFWILFHLI